MADADAQKLDSFISSYGDNRTFESFFFAESLDNMWTKYSPTKDLPEEAVASHIRGLEQAKVCRFCARQLTQRVEFEEDARRDRHSLSCNFEVFTCDDCGWWWATNKLNSYYSGSKYDDNRVSTFYHEALLRRFHASSQNLPIAELRRYLEKHPNIATSVHYSVFEKLVADVYRDYFGCDVLHVGGPGDNGIDLLLVQTEDPCLVQCKRRQADSAVEGIEAVRDLVGALVMADARKGHLVTSAKAFSQPAQRASKETGLVEHKIELTLVDRNELLRMLQIANSRLEPYWRSLAQSAMTKASAELRGFRLSYPDPPASPVIWNRRKKSNPLGGPTPDPKRRRSQ